VDSTVGTFRAGARLPVMPSLVQGRGQERATAAPELRAYRLGGRANSRGTPSAAASFDRGGSARGRSRVRQVADVFGPGSTALPMRKVAERALEHNDEECAGSRISHSRSWTRTPVTRRRPP
jgi:hypothetical protein